MLPLYWLTVQTVGTAIRSGWRPEVSGLEHVPADLFPHTAATADVVAAYNSDRQYRWGLDRLLDGIVGTAR